MTDNTENTTNENADEDLQADGVSSDTAQQHEPQSEGEPKPMRSMSMKELVRSMFKETTDSF